MWTPQGIVRNPLLRISETGRVLSVDECPDPDREPLTEFYAGLLVADFDADYRAAFAQLCACSGQSLAETLHTAITPGRGIVVAISGLDYDTLRPTPRTRIERV